jgi:hypothetical protein
MSNQGKAPYEIERKYTGEENEYLLSLKREFIRSETREKEDIFVPALEAHIFAFDSENIYFIDRKNRTCYMVKQG